jgi:hypothetical protein
MNELNTNETRYADPIDPFLFQFDRLRFDIVVVRTEQCRRIRISSVIKESMADRWFYPFDANASKTPPLTDYPKG